MSETIFEITALDECPGCNGSGKVNILPKPVKKNCPACKGSGVVRTVIGRGKSVSQALADFVHRTNHSRNDVVIAEVKHGGDEPIVAPV
jgi:DnaJ-class molecular chaperone